MYPAIRIVKQVLCVACGLSTIMNSANAENFIGLGQPGSPGTVSLQFYPTLSHFSPNTNAAKVFSEVSYTTKGGFSSESRDRFEFWVGGYAGYQSPHTNSGGGGWGGASPELGVEYYYQGIAPKQGAPFGTPDYREWWISPTLALDFPNGSAKSSGFGAGANQYTLSASVNNFVGIAAST